MAKENTPKEDDKEKQIWGQVKKDGKEGKRGDNEAGEKERKL